MNLRAQHYVRDLRRYYRLPATQVSLTLILSLIVVAIFVSFALRPTFITIVDLQKTIQESQKTLRELQVKTANLQKAAEVWETIKPMSESLNLGVVNQGAGYDPLVAQIEQITRATGVTLQSENLGSTLLFSRVIAPFTPNVNQTVVTLPLNIKVAGSYPLIREYLGRITQIERLIGIDSVTISKETGASQGNTVVALTINGSVYYLADQKQLTPILEVKRRSR